MNSGSTIFAQLMSFLPSYEFDKCVQRYQGDYRVRTFSCRQHFYVMAFAQLTYRESLRDIEVCLKALAGKLYHSGIRHSVSKSTLAGANEARDWRIYADFARVLIQEARRLYRADNDFLKDIDEAAYALDSSTIDLCLSMFPWATFRKSKAGIKLHTLMDLRGSIPSFIEITGARYHDVNILDLISIEPGAVYMMDMGYIDYGRLYSIVKAGGHFVTRAKSNMACQRVYSRPVDKGKGLVYDQTVKLVNYYAKKDYPEHLRRVKFHDKETGKTYVFLTNNLDYEAILVAMLYKERWKVELFFKWIKQHLRIKCFFGTSYNAVCAQIWIAITVYLLIAIVKKRMNLPQSLYTLLQLFSLSLFEKVPLNELVANSRYTNEGMPDTNQLKLFDF
jgi:hypothetical protein